MCWSHCLCSCASVSICPLGYACCILHCLPFSSPRLERLSCDSRRNQTVCGPRSSPCLLSLSRLPRAFRWLFKNGTVNMRHLCRASPILVVCVALSIRVSSCFGLSFRSFSHAATGIALSVAVLVWWWSCYLLFLQSHLIEPPLNLAHFERAPSLHFPLPPVEPEVLCAWCEQWSPSRTSPALLAELIFTHSSHLSSRVVSCNRPRQTHGCQPSRSKKRACYGRHSTGAPHVRWYRFLPHCSTGCSFVSSFTHLWRSPMRLLNSSVAAHARRPCRHGPPRVLLWKLSLLVGPPTFYP